MVGTTAVTVGVSDSSTLVARVGTTLDKKEEEEGEGVGEGKTEEVGAEESRAVLMADKTEPVAMLIGETVGVDEGVISGVALEKRKVEDIILGSEVAGVDESGP